MENNTNNNPKFLLDKGQGKDKQIQLKEFSNIIDNEMNTDKNNFPIDVFPVEIQDLIIEAEQTNNFNKDFFSAGILSICATAIGNSVSLFNGTYSSKPIFWISIIGKRGSGKTHPLTFAKKPIEQRDKDLYTSYKSELKGFNEQENKSKKPKYSKFILKDFTPEKLAENLQHNEKGLLIFQDELMRWINSFDQYKKGGDQQLYLELFNGGGLSVDRVTKEAIRVEETNVNILGGMQPELLKALSKNNRKDDGFLDRFLFVFPKNDKPKYFTGKDICEINKENYKKIIYNLLEAPKLVIKVNANNIKVFQDWQKPKADECLNDDLERALQSKLEIYTWRFALVLEMIKQAIKCDYKDYLSDQSIKDAIKLTEYFRVNSLKIHDTMDCFNPLENLPTQRIDTYKELPYEFKRKDVLPIFERHNIKGGSIGRFLSDKKLFKRIDNNGNYKKLL